MITTPMCPLTHRYICSGHCPWCEEFIADGQPAVASPAEKGESLRWNVLALLAAVGGGDAQAREAVLANLGSHTPFNSDVLAVTRQALRHPDRRTRAMVEDLLFTGGMRFVGDVEVWRQEAAQNPTDAAVRYFLIGYDLGKAGLTESSRLALLENVAWLVEHAPDTGLIGPPGFGLEQRRDGPGYDEVAWSWRRQLVLRPGDALVLGNAARFFVDSDPASSEALYREAKVLEPTNPTWPKRLAHLFLRVRPGEWPPPAERAAQAVAEWEAIARLCPEELRRPYQLSHLGYASLLAGEPGKAQSVGEGLLRLASEARNASRRAHAIHYGHLLLGHVRLSEGNVAEATRHLLEAADITEVTPGLATCGPNTWLADRLLKAGERSAVIQFLRICSGFWASRSQKADQWIYLLESGGEPDFSSNFTLF